MTSIDWTECDLIEIVPGKMSGAPVPRGTRVRAEDLLVKSRWSHQLPGREFRRSSRSDMATLRARRFEAPVDGP